MRAGSNVCFEGCAVCGYDGVLFVSRACFFVRTAEGSSSPALNAAAAGICWHVLACTAIDSCCVVWCGVLLCLCCHQARLLTPTGLTMLMWSVGNMDKAPPKAWVAKLLVATQVGGMVLSQECFRAPSKPSNTIGSVPLAFRPVKPTPACPFLDMWLWVQYVRNSGRGGQAWQHRQLLSWHAHTRPVS